MIDTADTVLHKPTGETWVVACVDETRNELSWCGWPEGYAKLSDCELQAKATEDERLKLLEQMAAMNCDDHRCRYATHRLSQAALKGASR